MKREIKLGIEFYISAFLALLFAIILLFTIVQSDNVNALCQSIQEHDNVKAKALANKVYNIDAISSNNTTPLIEACIVGNSEMIVYLLKNGADVNYAPPNQLTPLEHFCETGYMAGQEALSAMFNRWVKQSRYVEKPAVFHLAENYYRMNEEQKKIATEITIMLLQKGAPMGFNDTTLLHLAAKGNMGDLFYTIAHSTQGLNLLNSKDANGHTPWMLAVKNGAIDVQRVIRELEFELSEEPDDPLDSIFPDEGTSEDFEQDFDDDYDEGLDSET